MFKNLKQKLYNKLLNYDVEQYKRKTKSVSRYFTQGCSVVDIGCGSGWFARFLQTHYSCRVTGVDVIDYCTEKNINFIKYKGGKIPLADKSFDVAVCVSVIHHTNNPEEVLVELNRIAKTVILIEDYCTTRLGKIGLNINDYFTNILQNLHKCWCGYHSWRVYSMQWKLRFRTKNELLDCFKQNNITVTSFQRTPVSWKGMSHGVYILN